jgi:hypothetical protein
MNIGIPILCHKIMKKTLLVLIFFLLSAQSFERLVMFIFVSIPSETVITLRFGGPKLI